MARGWMRENARVFGAMTLRQRTRMKKARTHSSASGLFADVRQASIKDGACSRIRDYFALATICSNGL